MRGVGLVAVAAVLLGGVVVGATQRGHSAQEVRMGSGAVWLASARVGQVSLLDGSSAEVAAQVAVAPPGNVLDVAQWGGTGYAVDRTTGTVRRVDGATFEMSEPESPIPGADAGLTALPGPGALYTVDTRRGVLADVDPGTLARRGELLPLASRLSAGTATVDDAGTLWAVDNATGDLVRVAGGNRTVRRQVAKPGRAVLTVAKGHPVVVDLDGRRATGIDRETGEVTGTTDLDLRPDDTVRVSGSSRADRLYVVADRGSLAICDLPGDCGTVVPLDTGGTFGTPVEAGDRLFVPNYATGQVVIIDLARSRVVARPTVLSPPGEFQLLTRDGVVFYNDAYTERAGVIRLDGTVVAVAKYDPANPSKGIRAPGTGAVDAPPADSGQPPSDSGQPPTDAGEPPVDSGEPPRDPGESSTDSGQPPRDPGQPPVDSGEPPRDPGEPPTDSGEPPTDPGQPPSDAPRPRLEISATTRTPTVNEPVTLRANNTAGDAPTSARWTFGDGEQGDGATTTHAWAQPRNGYLVTVVATFADGQQATTSVSITVTETPKVSLTVNIIGDGQGGRIEGGGVNCPQLCQVELEPGTRITLRAVPDPGRQLGSWGNACSQSRDDTCDLTVNADTTVSYRFGTPTPTFRLTVGQPSGGSVQITTNAGGPARTCPPTCGVTVDEGTVVGLSANPNPGRTFGGWGGACAGNTNSVCFLTMNGDKSVSATFGEPPPPPQPPVISNLHCEFVGRGRFLCDVFQSGGTQVRWTIEGNSSGDNDNDNSLDSGCVDDRTGVKVTVSNSAGEDTASRTVICEGDPQ